MSDDEDEVLAMVRGIAQVTGYSDRTVAMMAVKHGIDLETCDDADLRRLVEELVAMGDAIKASLRAGPPKIRCNGYVIK